MKKIAVLVMTLLLVASCSKTSDPIYDGGQTLIYFTRSQQTLEVILDEGGSLDVSVTATQVVDFDREVTVELASTTFEPQNEDEENPDYSNNFVFEETFVIPAGEFTGEFTVTGFDDGDVTTENEIIEFQFAGADGDNVVFEGRTDVVARLVCPIDADQFVGDYFIEQINPPVGDGANLFGPGVIELFRPEGEASTSRGFEAVYLEELGIGQPASLVIFDIACGQINVAEGITTGLLCVQGEPAIELGPAENPSIIDTSDDSQFEITIRDLFVDGGCGDAFDVTLQLTKQ